MARWWAVSPAYSVRGDFNRPATAVIDGKLNLGRPARMNTLAHACGATPAEPRLLLDPSGSEVGRAISNMGGAYLLPRAPGTYEIVPQPVAGLMGSCRRLQ
jgi:hypothetical protein